jgi:hypothetical protein
LSHDDFIDAGRIDFGAGENGLDHAYRERGRCEWAQRAAEGPNGGTQGRDYGGSSHGRLLQAAVLIFI